MGLEVRTVSNLWPKIKEAMQEATKSHVAVGWPGESGKTNAQHDPLSGMTNVQVAVANEVGSAPGVRPQVPARPMVAETMWRIELPAKKLTAELLKQISEGKMSVRVALGRLGTYAQGELRQSIRMPAGGWKAANAPSTIARKKSSTPLTDTGHLGQSVSYVLRMRGRK